MRTLRLNLPPFLLILACVSSAAWADWPAANERKPGSAKPAERAASEWGPLNIPTCTLGGTQFWTDLVLFRDWRIQKNVYTGHCRLLDGGNVRRAWGGFAHCQAVLDKYKHSRDLPPMRGKVAILLHGLCCTRYSMNSLGRYLVEHGDYSVLNMTYASSRQSLDDDAAALDSVLAHLDGVERIDLVGHSMGNIVVRRYFAMRMEAEDGRGVDPRIRRFVMIGPPNNGSNLAERFDDSLVGTVCGSPLKKLGDEWDELKDRLATPTCEFAIIAGDMSQSGVDNPLVPGDDDLMVGVSETRLPGARDFLALPVVHSVMEYNEKVQQATLRFLEHGYLTSADSRAPIPADKMPSMKLPVEKRAMRIPGR